jgi:hypothetical protein
MPPQPNFDLKQSRPSNRQLLSTREEFFVFLMAWFRRHDLGPPQPFNNPAEISPAALQYSYARGG